MPTKAPTLERPPLPTGLSFEERPGKPSPYFARWREPGGSKRARSFQTEEERWRFAEVWQKTREKWGVIAPQIHPREAETWKIFAELTGGADPLEVARFWLKHHRERGGEMQLSDAVKNFLKMRGAESKTGDSASHLRLHLRRLDEAFAAQKLAAISTAKLRAWLKDLKNPDTGAPLEPYTVRHHVRTLKFFFSIAAKERWLDDNPAEAIEIPKIEAGEIHVLSADDAVKLFAVNRDSLCIGRLALEAFGGLRYTSAARITREDIIEAEHGIVMPGAKHKSGRRHYVDGYPENLWKWLKHAPEACWQIPQRIYLDQKAECFRRAGVKNPGNVLRHSFCTYHVALHKDAARTAVLLTHTRPAMLYQHYRGRGSEADAKRYFSISP